mmetsp:Transcript_55197/g.159848  ORF Transcript_55197/g.159848 Transcript_55197/m.159848 type:complete len:364 (-) Transcript_55197:162-1253(-)
MRVVRRRMERRWIDSSFSMLALLIHSISDVMGSSSKWKASYFCELSSCKDLGRYTAGLKRFLWAVTVISRFSHRLRGSGSSRLEMDTSARLQKSALSPWTGAACSSSTGFANASFPRLTSSISCDTILPFVLAWNFPEGAGAFGGGFACGSFRRSGAQRTLASWGTWRWKCSLGSANAALAASTRPTAVSIFSVHSASRASSASQNFDPRCLNNFSRKTSPGTICTDAPELVATSLNSFISGSSRMHAAGPAHEPATKTSSSISRKKAPSPMRAKARTCPVTTRIAMTASPNGGFRIASPECSRTVGISAMIFRAVGSYRICLPLGIMACILLRFARFRIAATTPCPKLRTRPEACFSRTLHS